MLMNVMYIYIYICNLQIWVFAWFIAPRDILIWLACLNKVYRRYSK